MKILKSYSKITVLFIFSIFIAFISCKDNSMNEEQLIAKAKAIHDRVITLDTHNDINIDNFTDSIN